MTSVKVIHNLSHILDLAFLEQENTVTGYMKA